MRSLYLPSRSGFGTMNQGLDAICLRVTEPDSHLIIIKYRFDLIKPMISNLTERKLKAIGFYDLFLFY